MLIEPALTGTLDLPSSRLGSQTWFRAAGPGEDPSSAEPVPLLVKGAALLPPCPVHLRADPQPDGALRISWIRRSRQGWGWVDGVDTPLAEEREAYRLVLLQEGGTQRIVEPDASFFTYSASERGIDGSDPARLSVAVAQLSALAGPGTYTVADFILEE